MSQFNGLQLILLAGIPLIFAITVHEVAHGWVADQLGDPTAKKLGRLTLNPLKHVDLIGTVLLPIALILLTGFAFGWAKPVPITWSNLYSPRRDMALVALAGPLANLVMACGWTVVVKGGGYGYYSIKTCLWVFIYIIWVSWEFLSIAHC